MKKLKRILLNLVIHDGFLEYLREEKPRALRRGYGGVLFEGERGVFRTMWGD